LRPSRYRYFVKLELFSDINFLGRICVPIDSSDPAAFDPLAVPTVTELLSEIDSWEKTQDGHSKERISDWEKTNLKDYIRYFKQYVDRIMADERSVKKERGEELGGMAMNGKMLEF
jgi:DNA primase small subunit